MSLFDTETAIEGVTAVLPLLPASALFESSLVEEAESLMSFAPLIDAPSPTCAVVSVMPMLTPIAAPTPVLPPASCLPLAFVELATKFSAVNATSPPSVMVTVAELAIAALLWLMPTLTASAPAMPVSIPLTPAVASAEKLSTLSLDPTCGTSACTIRPSAVMSELPTSASLVTRATLTATAMPTPVPAASASTGSRLCVVPVGAG